MDDAVHAIMMAFAVIVFVIAFSIAMYMFSKVTSTAEVLALYTDSTLYYDNIKDTYFEDGVPEGATLESNRIRKVTADTIIPTLYRYADEEFCVKIYDNSHNLIQIFDLDLEGKVQSAIADTTALSTAETTQQKKNFVYKSVYNNSNKPYYLWGAPWLGNKENVKLRVDLFVNGKAGYINNIYVNYKDNAFYKMLSGDIKDQSNPENTKCTQFEERFVSYSWSGQTMTTDDGDVLVTGNSPKDKIVITYTQI